MTTAKLVENYAFQINKPFKIKDVIGMLDISYAMAKYHCGNLAKAKKIRVMRRHKQTITYVWHDGSTDNPTRPEEILWETICKHPGKSQSQLITQSGLARTTVERWLRAFRAEEIVTYNKQNHNTFCYTAAADHLPAFQPLKTYGVRYEQKSA